MTEAIGFVEFMGNYLDLMVQFLYYIIQIKYVVYEKGD